MQLQHTRHKYTAPTLHEVVNKKRSKFSAHRPHRSHEFSQAEMELLKLKNIEKLDSGCRSDPATSRAGLYNVTSLEAQMESLSTKGFLRAYRSYTPPADVRPRFLSVCSRVLDQPVAGDQASLRAVRLDCSEVKFRVLSALCEEFGGHAVHSSRLHEMQTLADALLYYESAVCTLNPYELLHQEQEAGSLPQNLVIQKDPIRFTGQGDHPLDKVTAYPRSRTLVTGLDARDKFPGHEPEVDPWEDMDYK